MKTYEKDDIATFYFVLKEEDGSNIIKAWTDDKKLLDAYMEIHSCKKYRVKKIRRIMRDIYPIINENYHDEIDIANVITRGKNNMAGLISLPMTMTEITFLNDESAGFFSSNIDYQFLDATIPYLKDRYKRSLDMIWLEDVIQQVIYNRSSPFIQDTVLDQVLLFARSFQDDFDA